MASLPSDRDLVLGRVRAALEGREAKPEGMPLPPVMRADGLDGLDAAVFVERMAMTGATVLEVPTSAALPSAIRGVLDDLGAKVVAASDLPVASVLLDGYGGEVMGPEAARADLFRCDAGISGVHAAIAETGTLVLSTETERNRLTSLIPEVHLAIVRRDQIVPSLDHALESFGASEGQSPPPRCITFITGPSRTADIELELVVGVHGPKALYVFLVG